MQRRGLDNEKKIWADAEVYVEVAGDHIRIAVAFSTDFRSEFHLDDFLLQSIFGVFQQYLTIRDTESVTASPSVIAICKLRDGGAMFVFVGAARRGDRALEYLRRPRIEAQWFNGVEALRYE